MTPGFTRQPENSKRAHFKAPALQTPQGPQEREERKNIVVGEGKKSEILGGPAEEGSGRGGVRGVGRSGGEERGRGGGAVRGRGRFLIIYNCNCDYE